MSDLYRIDENVSKAESDHLIDVGVLVKVVGPVYPHIKVLQKTEVVDTLKWRLLPATVETDHKGRHWIPEHYVVEMGDNE
jgi:hypothetical protein